MSDFNSLGFSRPLASGVPDAPITNVIIQRPLDRIFAFTRRTIDDVVNNPLVKNQIYGYYKLQRTIERRSDVLDLERQWNPLGRRT